MSEPVSNAEIEDVLSSIRRLVSNDVVSSQEESASETAEAEVAGKLILTADFRVPEPQDIDGQEDRDAPANEDVAQDAAQVETADDTPIEFHHTEHSSVVDPEPAQQETNEVWQDSTEQAKAEPDVVAEDATSTLEHTIADLEAAIGQQQGEWEPDGSDFEEDADAEEVMSEPVQDWIDGTAQEVGAEAEAEELNAADEDADLFGGEDSVIDEETLRDMVSDIVRQELQGALGERITRNVRKLVRREINRVLAAQDFD